MSKAEILAFIQKNPFCALATVEDGQPRVRMVMVLRADERGILFNTGKAKDLYKQIQGNASAELCFFDASAQTQVRVRGHFVMQENPQTHALVLEKLPFLKSMVESKGTGVLAPYLLKGAKATVWTMATNMEPKTFVEL